MLLKLISSPWPWYIAGPIIGLMVPLLLLLGNRSFGISSSLRHICAACFPTKIPFFTYEWKKEIWNLFFAGGIVIGGFVAAHWLADPSPVQISPKLENTLGEFGITNHNNLLPSQLFNWPALLTIRGFILIIVGGFLVGFGTRYAGGCTSGHSIMGLSTLQWPSLVATCCFMAGGFIMSNLILPFILNLS